MLRAIAMARQTRRAIAARCSLVRVVARRAGVVAGDGVHARQLGLVVTARARRRLRRTIRAVRPMTARTCGVLALGLVGVTGRAARRRVARVVRLVTAGALLVTRRCGGRLGGVAARARCRWRLGSVQRVRVTALAVGMAGVRRRAHTVGVALAALHGGFPAVRGVAERAVGVGGASRRARAIGVAMTAGRRVRDRLAGVRDVAVEARRCRVLLGLVAGHAGDGLRAGCDRVNRVAPGARAAGMQHLVLVTARARARRVIVRRVTAGARGVRLRREHGLIAMAGRARRDLGRRERVGLVATRAALVSRRDRALVDVALVRLRRVAVNTMAIGGRLGLVHAMAVEAAARARVFRLLLGVTLDARCRLE